MPPRYKLPISDWLKFYGWKENPFRVKVSGENSLFVSFEELKISMIDRARAGDITNITGSTGIGKTEWSLQLHRWLETSGWIAVYVDLSGTGMDINSFLRTVWTQVHPSFLIPFLGKKLTVEKVLSYIKKTAEKKPICIIIDEAQNIADRRITDAIRRINDNCKNVSFILSSIEDLTRNKAFRESIRRRMSLIPLRGMSLDESESLLMKRIRNAGGENKTPFSRDLVEFIWRKSNKLPGLLLHYAEDLCIHNARGPRLTIIKADWAASVLGAPVTPKTELEKPRVAINEVKPQPEKLPRVPKPPTPVQARRVLEVLSPQQQSLLLATKDAGTFMIEELASKLGMDYNVVRTQLNRINKKVGADVVVLVKKAGKDKYWKLADNYRILFSAE